MVSLEGVPTSLIVIDTKADLNSSLHHSSGESATTTEEVDAVHKGDKVAIIDDLLATGGTLDASCRLIRQLGGEVVAIGVLIELSFLKGRQKLPGCDILALIDYDGE